MNFNTDTARKPPEIIRSATAPEDDAKHRERLRQMDQPAQSQPQTAKLPPSASKSSLTPVSK